MEAKSLVYVDKFTDGVLDPNRDYEYFVKDGGRIIANTAPGCWGPMLTPELKGGHEVTRPVYVDGAEVGDAIAIYIEDIQVTSQVTASGSDKPLTDAFEDDPFVDGTCPNCKTLNPETEISGVGSHSIRCKVCGETFAPFSVDHGYTMTFDHDIGLGVTVDANLAEKFAKEANKFACMPENSIQNSVISQMPTDLIGTIARLRPFLGQLGTLPSDPYPDSHNAGDFGQFLIGASHEFGKETSEELASRTDGHMDINRVREGAILVAPVKVAGGGVYLGDMHAMQGNGEIAGHTTDVSGIVRLKVKVIKDLTIDGPLLFPLEEDLPYLAKPFSVKEKQQIEKLKSKYKSFSFEESLPISVIGTGANLNEATENGLQRASDLFEVSVGEILNRSTITGSIDIGRNPGVVTVTFLVPKNYLERQNLLYIAETMYE